MLQFCPLERTNALELLESLIDKDLLLPNSYELNIE